MLGVSIEQALGRRWSRWAAALLLAGIWLAMVAGAQAGTYVIDNCPSAPTGNGNAGPWTVFGAPQNTKGSCSGGPGNWIGPLGASMSPGEVDGVQVAVPAGSAITIREAKVWWFVPHQISGADTFAIAGVNTGGVEEAGTPKNSSVTPDDFVLPSTTTKLTLGDYCSNDDAGAGCTFGGGENPDLELLGAQLTLADGGLPSGSVTGGALAGAGPVSGTQSLAYHAEDTGSGVRLAELLVDGQPVAKNDYIAECPYQNFAACPPNVSGTIGWNTESVGNGSHEVALRIVNAAHNMTILDSHTITIDNAPNPNAPTGTAAIGPGSPLALRGPANGTNASDQATLAARWKSTAKATRTSGYGAVEEITGRLTAPGNIPISGASLDVFQTSAYEGARTVPLAGVHTGPTGAWTLTLPRDTASSSLHFEYRSHQNDTVPVATAALTLRVHAGIALKIAPRITRVGRRIVFSGALHGAPIPPGGKQLVLEASSGDEWIQFRTITTDAKGRYRASYRFKFPGPVVYRFRVLSPQEADFPFLNGTSNVVAVYER
jgi:hypothetical protein